jgi:purine-cytosine permease-like protein
MRALEDGMSFRGSGSTRPSKAASCASALFVTVLLCVAGAAALESREKYAWVPVILLVIVGAFSVANLIRPEGVPSSLIEFQVTSEGAAGQPAAGGLSAGDRLRELDQLHGEGLLTDDEFLAKRAEIIAEL